MTQKINKNRWLLALGLCFIGIVACSSGENPQSSKEGAAKSTAPAASSPSTTTETNIPIVQEPASTAKVNNKKTIPLEKIGPAQQLGKQIDESLRQTRQQLQKLTAPGGPLDKATKQLGRELQVQIEKTIESINKTLKKNKMQQQPSTEPMPVKPAPTDSAGQQS